MPNFYTEVLIPGTLGIVAGYFLRPLIDRLIEAVKEKFGG